MNTRKRTDTDTPPPEQQAVIRANRLYRKVLIADITETQLQEILKVLNKSDIKLYN